MGICNFSSDPSFIYLSANEKYRNYACHQTQSNYPYSFRSRRVVGTPSFTVITGSENIVSKSDRADISPNIR